MTKKRKLYYKLFKAYLCLTKIRIELLFYTVKKPVSIFCKWLSGERSIRTISISIFFSKIWFRLRLPFLKISIHNWGNAIKTYDDVMNEGYAKLWEKG